MATINDIAKKAGVSHGTVSNVLNKKGSVSAKKIKLVEEAARELGYVINAQAKQLRGGPADTVAIILPNLSLKKYSDLYTGIMFELKKHNLVANVCFTEGVAHIEEQQYLQALEKKPLAIVIVNTLLDGELYLKCPVKMVFAYRKPPLFANESSFYGFDYDKVGDDIVKKFVDNKYKKINIFSNNLGLSDESKFVSKITRNLDREGIEFNVFESDEAMNFLGAFDVINNDECDCVFSTNIEQARMIAGVLGTYGKNHIEIYSIANSDLFADCRISKYGLNYKFLGKCIGEEISKQNFENNVVLESGMFFLEVPKCNYNQCMSTIKFLTIPTPTTSALKLILPEFERNTGIRVELIEVGYDEALAILNNTERRKEFDIARLDMLWLQKFENIFIELDENSNVIQKILNQLISLPDEYRIENDLFKFIPLDPSVQLFFYRKDLFENSLIQRKFFEKYKSKLEIPNTYEKFKNLLEFFTKDKHNESPTKLATSYCYESILNAASDFMFRLVEADFCFFKRDINFEEEKLNDYFKNYKDEIEFINYKSNKGWSEAVANISNGRTAFSIVYSNYVSYAYTSENSSIIGKLGYGKIPGGQPLLGGGSIGIMQHSEKIDECLTFLEWLYHPHTASMITYLGGFLPNKCIQKNVNLLQRYPWLEEIEQHFSTGWRRLGKITNSEVDEFRFEELLDKYLKKYLREDEGEFVIKEFFEELILEKNKI